MSDKNYKKIIESAVRDAVNGAPYANEDTSKFLFIKNETNGDLFDILTDPHKQGFKLFFHFSATSGLLASENYQNSALAYLKRIGDDYHYNLLLRFITILSKINSSSAWMFQSIDGLSESMNTPYGEFSFNKKLTVNCLETVDNKIASLNIALKQIIFDNERGVYRLPENLRKFSISVYVYDVRTFQSYINKSSQELVDYNYLQSVNMDFSDSDLLTQGDITYSSVADINHVLFDFGHCQFGIDSGTSPYSSVSNIDHEFTQNTITIDYEKTSISGLFRTLFGENDLSKESSKFIETSLDSGTTESDFLPQNTILERIQNSKRSFLDTDNWKTKIDNVSDVITSKALDRTRATLTSLYLGNACGWTPDVLARNFSSPEGRKIFLNTYGHLPNQRSLLNDLK